MSDWSLSAEGFGTSAHHGRRGIERGAVRGIAQHPLGDTFAKDARFPPGSAQDRPLDLLALARAPVGLKPARPALEGDHRALRGLDRDPREAGDRLVGLRLEREGDLLALAARAALVAAVARVQRADGPAQPRG